MDKKLCPINIRIEKGECKPVEPKFDDDPANMKTFLWHGTQEEFFKYINTPWGAMTIFEARRGGPVTVLFSTAVHLS